MECRNCVEMKESKGREAEEKTVEYYLCFPAALYESSELQGFCACTNENRPQL